METARPQRRRGGIVVTIAEAHHLAVREIAVKVERLERELCEFVGKRLFLSDGEHVRMIAKSLGQPRGSGEEIGLIESFRRLDAIAALSVHPP